MELLTYRRCRRPRPPDPAAHGPTLKRRTRATLRIDEGHFTARFQRDEQVDAEGVERRRARDARVVVVDARRAVLPLVAEVDREVIARTVFWKSRFAPLRSVPRWTLSCFEGTQALGRRARAPRRPGSSAHRCPRSRSRACRCARSVMVLDRGQVGCIEHQHFATAGRRLTSAVASPGNGGVMKRET